MLTGNAAKVLVRSEARLWILFEWMQRRKAGEQLTGEPEWTQRAHKRAVYATTAPESSRSAFTTAALSN